MYFEQNVAGQANRRDGTTCMDTTAHTNIQRNMPCTQKDTQKKPTDTHAHAYSVRLKDMTPVLIWAANSLCSELWGYTKAAV